MKLFAHLTLRVAAAGVAISLIALASRFSIAAAAGVQDCQPVLTQDYYSYAASHSLQLDWLNSIDRKSWENLKTTNSGSLFAIFQGGAFSLQDDYSHFDDKRSTYLVNQSFRRTEQQSLNILQITTSPRTYDAYVACLNRLPAGSGVVAWASRESINQIDLRVKYLNPSGVAEQALTGTVSGGSVVGAPAGNLWAPGTKWGVNQEFLFTVMTTPGFSETDVTISSADGAPATTLTFHRADASVKLTYVGSTDVLRATNQFEKANTPNNSYNKKGNCIREVGRSNGICISRTNVNVATHAPLFLANVRAACEPGNAGCGFISQGPVSIGTDGLTASTYVDNNGPGFDEFLYYDLYEHVSAQQCGSDSEVPLAKGNSIVLTVNDDCLPIASLIITELPTGNQSAATFGAPVGVSSPVTFLGKLHSGKMTIATYGLK